MSVLRIQISKLVVNFHIRADNGEGRNGNIAVQRRMGIDGVVIVRFVHANTLGQIHIISLGQEIVGVVMTALTANADALDIEGDVHVVKAVYIHQLVLQEEIQNHVQMVGGMVIIFRLGG